MLEPSTTRLIFMFLLFFFFWGGGGGGSWREVMLRPSAKGFCIVRLVARRNPKP